MHLSIKTSSLCHGFLVKHPTYLIYKSDGIIVKTIKVLNNIIYENGSIETNINEFYLENEEDLYQKIALSWDEWFLGSISYAWAF